MQDPISPSQRRGRFLIQEVQDNIVKKHGDSQKEAGVCILKKSLLTKRSKHSSIVMDSKITHFTHEDTYIDEPLFIACVLEESSDNWVDFESIWHKFSKIHCNMSEDSMERLFNYTYIQIEEDNFFSPDRALTVSKELKIDFIRQDEKLIINGLGSNSSGHTKLNIISDDGKRLSIFSNKKESKNYLKNFDINFFDNNILSPSFSPINNINQKSSRYLLDLKDQFSSQFRSDRCGLKRLTFQAHNTSEWQKIKEFSSPLKSFDLQIIQSSNFSLLKGMTKQSEAGEGSMKIENNSVEIFGVKKQHMCCCNCINNSHLK